MNYTGKKLFLLAFKLNFPWMSFAYDVSVSILMFLINRWNLLSCVFDCIHIATLGRLWSKRLWGSILIQWTLVLLEWTFLTGTWTHMDVYTVIGSSARSGGFQLLSERLEDMLHTAKYIVLFTLQLLHLTYHVHLSSKAHNQQSN